MLIIKAKSTLDLIYLGYIHLSCQQVEIKVKVQVFN